MSSYLPYGGGHGYLDDDVDQNEFMEFLMMKRRRNQYEGMGRGFGMGRAKNPGEMSGPGSGYGMRSPGDSYGMRMSSDGYDMRGPGDGYTMRGPSDRYGMRSSDNGYGMGAFADGYGMRGSSNDYGLRQSGGIHMRGLSRPMGRGRGINFGSSNRPGFAKKSKMAGSSGRGSEEKAKPVKKKKVDAVQLWRKTAFYCLFCKVDTVDKKNHQQHIQSYDHRKAIKERTQFLHNKARLALKQCIKQVTEAKLNGTPINYCIQCNFEYADYGDNHKQSPMHKDKVYTMAMPCNDCNMTFQSRINYELHAVSFNHLRNQRYALISKGTVGDDFSCPDTYDENTIVGNYYVTDTKYHYCRVCKLVFHGSVQNHCTSESHFDLFKEFIKAKKEEAADGKMKVSEQKLPASDDDDDDEPMEDEVEKKEEEEEVEKKTEQNGE